MLPAVAQIDSTLINPLARAFRWRRLLETGAYGTIEELAAAEKINPSYVSRILRLRLLAPDIVGRLEWKAFPKGNARNLDAALLQQLAAPPVTLGVCFRSPDRKAYARTKYYRV